jgi:hypothetical protein
MGEWSGRYRERSRRTLDASSYDAFELDYAENHDIIELRQAFQAATDFLTRDRDSDGDGETGKLVALAVIAAVALAAGILTTATLIKLYAATASLPTAPDRPKAAEEKWEGDWTRL